MGSLILWEKSVAKGVRRQMSPGRWAHSQEVAGWARTLADVHGADPVGAYQAGLLHDLAKEWSPRALGNYVNKKNVRVPGWNVIRQRKLFSVCHGYVSAHLVRTRGWVTDPAPLRAMERHTLGHPRMTVLDQVVFVADYSSSDRSYKEATVVRKMATKDLEGALRRVVAAKVQEVVHRGQFLHPVTVQLWNALAGGVLRKGFCS